MSVQRLPENKSVMNVLKLSLTAQEEPVDKKLDKEDDPEKEVKGYSYKLKNYALIFTSKQPHDYSKMGQEETPKTIYEKGEAFSIKGDNFSWLHIGILFEFRKGEKIGEGIYSRNLNPDASFDPQGVPQVKGLKLDPVGVKGLESQLKIFSGNMIKLPPLGNPVLAEAPSEGLNRLAFDENSMEQLLKGKHIPSLKIINNVDFSEKYDSFNYRLNYKGKLHSVFRQPVQGYQGTPEQIHKTEENVNPFEPIDEQKKKSEPKMETKKAKEETDGYETGGFDIMKQLVKKQRKHMPIRKTSVTAQITKLQPAMDTSKTDTMPDISELKKKEKEHEEKSKLYKQMADKVKKLDQKKISSVLKKYFSVYRLL